MSGSSQSSLVVLPSSSFLPASVVEAYSSAAYPDAVSFSSSVIFASTPLKITKPTQFISALVASSHDVPNQQEIFSEVLKLLLPEGSLFVYDPLLEDPERQQASQKDLLLAGFTGGRVDAYSGCKFLKGTKPSWEVGAKSTLLKKPKAPAGPTPVPSSAFPVGASVDDRKEKAWVLHPGMEGDDELMNEDDLLTEDDKRPSAAPLGEADCNTSSKKACKNCSCGRAEMETAEETKDQASGVKLTPVQLMEGPAAPSACGNCYLGDAFRCGGCPYKGLPAFEPGSKVLLADLTADV